MTDQFALATPEKVATSEGAMTIHGRFWKASNPAEKTFPARQRVDAATAEEAAAQFKAKFPRIRKVSLTEYTLKQRGDRVETLYSHCFSFGLGGTVPGGYSDRSIAARANTGTLAN